MSTSKLNGQKRRRRSRQGFKLPAFEKSTQLRKLEDNLVGEEECEALLNLAQVRPFSLQRLLLS